MNVAKCARCGRLAFPSHAICPNCRGSEFEEHELTEGVVVSNTVLRVPPPGLTPPVPIAIVEFEGGVRALGQLTESAEVGTQVVPEWGFLREAEGRVYEGFRFRPR
ncbi:MAG: Zn-ribbon domain-containing OB-fold protein [Thermoplasmata archaeon]